MTDWPAVRLTAEHWLAIERLLVQHGERQVAGMIAGQLRGDWKPSTTAATSAHASHCPRCWARQKARAQKHAAEEGNYNAAMGNR